MAACRQKRRVRFATAAALVNELVEAKQQLQLRRVLARWERYDVIAIDEVGYVPMAELGAEFLFQVIAERAEKAAVILTTNLPFSEWTQVIPNRPALQGAAGPDHRSRPHRRNRRRQLTASGERSRKAGLNPRADRCPRWTSGFRYAPARSPANLHPTCPANCHRWAKVNCHRWAKNTCQTQCHTRGRFSARARTLALSSGVAIRVC